MIAATSPTLYLERPCFWTESGDLEAWLRALEVLATAASEQRTGTPRTVAERLLAGVLSRRSALGLFGAYRRMGRWLLPGVGLVTCDESGQWTIADEASNVLAAWRADPALGLAQLAAHVVHESPWLRLLLLRVTAGDWEIVNWPQARSSRTGLKVGFSLRLVRHVAPDGWFLDVESQTAGRWLARTCCDALAYVPELLTRRKGKDDLSLAPLTAPLHLLETVGWLSPRGQLQLPDEVMADLVGHMSAARALIDITHRRADLRGYLAVEPALRELLSSFGAHPDDAVFARWMDTLVDGAVARGALEILAAEPGQARHGRGLGGDPTRKLVRWAIHPEFDDHFRNTWAIAEPPHSHPMGPGHIP